MRRFRIVLITVVALFGVSIAAVAIVPGVPEIDPANAKMSLSPSPAFNVKRCAGEDGIRYATYRGGWQGPENDLTGTTDYSLSGQVTIRAVVWTINLSTKRGVLTGAATLISSAGTGTVYSGKLTLLTLGLPVAGAVVSARGWLSASTFINNQPDGGSLLANLEFSINGTFAATGVFGDSAPTFNTPTYAVATANQVC